MLTSLGIGPLWDVYVGPSFLSHWLILYSGSKNSNCSWIKVISLIHGHLEEERVDDDTYFHRPYGRQTIEDSVAGWLRIHDGVQTLHEEFRLLTNIIC